MLQFTALLQTGPKRPTVADMASPGDDSEPPSPQLPQRTATDRSSADTPRAGQPEPKGLKSPSRIKRQGTHKSALQWATGWETKGRAPYHDYIHKLVEAGWDNLKDVDEHMNQNSEDKDLVVSVVDILDTMTMKRRVDIRDVPALDHFLANESREGVKVRLYMAEQRGKLSSAVMESLGANLKLDPRFFQWNIKGSKNLMSPADRHRAPFTSVGFTVLDPSTAKVTDTFFFRTTIYIQPDQEGDGWTGQPFCLLLAKHTNSGRCYPIQLASENRHIHKCCCDSATLQSFGFCSATH